MKPNHKKTILKDVTFLIPTRIESIERLENIIAVVEHLQENFETNVMILEASPRKTFILKKCLPENVEIYFVEDDNQIFHRTRYINDLVSLSKTPYIAIWDTDVIVKELQISQSVELLRSQKADFVFPYDGVFLEIGYVKRLEFLKKKEISVLFDGIAKMFPLYGYFSVGGGFIANKVSYLEAGMENMHFDGWGPEDGERATRWDILDFKVLRTIGPMFHLTHPRGINSGMRKEEELNNGIKEYLRICKMSQMELKNEIARWGIMHHDLSNTGNIEKI
ncbi:MAG: hypothetical protein DI598_10550 [Pseudopedobacter saltans]|uniref:Galactosyltransferase C-terminal domain-containing protein n=1 Tax=Pseudopedobacter saltans TaxID=151895 RepID=A0A2W5EXG3_9SPHI|nr:MAG: hypothetical protein DI598_10550 [Pseudopedobacter saltans]